MKTTWAMWYSIVVAKFEVEWSTKAGETK